MMKSTIQWITKPFARCFVAGLLAILPLVITVAIVFWVADFLRGYLGPDTFIGGALKNLGLQFSGENAFASYAMGWVLVLAVVFALGVVVQLGAKSLIQRSIEKLFAGIPLIGNIYTTSQKFVELMDSKDTGSLQGMSAVFCFFGGDRATAVLAFLVSPERFKIEDREYQIVIIPTAPVPIGGAMVFVPSDQVVQADMNVDGLMSIYLSMGVTAGEYFKTDGQVKPVK